MRTRVSFNLSLTVPAIIFAAQDYIMRKLLVAFFALTVSASAFAQTTESEKLKPEDIINRAGDHFMVQLASNFWSGTPDSIDSHIKGLNRSANVYLMLNKPFKTNPGLSVAFGIGVGTSNIYFKKMTVDIAGTNSNLNFINADNLNRYKKYKLSLSYLEVPVEFRFSAKPATPNKSVKAAIGLKVGTMLNAHTKGKTLQSSTGSVISNSIDKVNSKSYFNTTRLAATARVGYGIFSLFGAYNLTSLFKDGVAEQIKPFQIGLTISGL